MKAPVFLSNEDEKDLLNLLKEYQKRPKSSPCYGRESKDDLKEVTQAFLVAVCLSIMLVGVVIGMVIN